MNTVKSLFLTKEYRFLEDGAVSAADKADIILEKVLLSLNFYLFSPNSTRLWKGQTLNGFLFMQRWQVNQKERQENKISLFCIYLDI